MPLDVKICGLKEPEHVAAALEGGASHVGFIFFEKSPRNVSAQTARALFDKVRGRLSGVAVTVDADRCVSGRYRRRHAPDMLQLHGAETPERVAQLKLRHGLPVMKALSIREAADLPPPRPIWALQTGSCSTPSRRRAPICRAATAFPSTGRCLTALTDASTTCFPVGSMPRNVGGCDSQYAAPAASTFRPVSKARRASRMPG